MTESTDHLREKRVELILQQLEQLPTLPAVAIAVLQATAGDADSSASEVVGLIQSDVSLTTRILQLVHRADLGVRGEVNTVERAVQLLGFEAVRSAVLAVSIFETMGGQGASSVGTFSREEFWKHSIAVACCAELLAASCGTGYQPVQTDPKTHGLVARATDQKLDTSEAFVCGLLHDLGKVALDAVLPKSFARVIEAAELLRGNIADVERTVIGIDHMVAGKRLAERWQLPTVIRECIWLHGQLPEALPATVNNPRMVNLVTLADLLVRRQHLGYSGNYTFAVSQDSLTSALGIGVDQIELILQRLIAHIEMRARAIHLDQSSTAELYHQALSQANKELGRVSSQLAAKNRKLATRAKFFDALSGFQSELHPDSTPNTVLRAIGQTAVAVLDVTSAAVFSAAPGQTYAETLLFDHAGDVFETTLVDCPAPPARVASGDGPILYAGETLEWLLAAISPRLGHEHRFWICLHADGQCVGGVVWGAPRGESQRLSPQVQELTAMSSGWSLALRTAQIRDEARTLSEQLAEANRQLQSAQNEILRSKMMISIGEMAAGAAHEMNNPLAIISGRSQLLSGQLDDVKLKHAAMTIHEQSHRLSQIISELMDFAKPVPPRPHVCDVSDLLRRAMHDARLQSDALDRHIELTLGDTPAISVDADQVGAAITEVIANAIQATSENNGQIEIHSAFDSYGSRVVVTIADNGCGMEEAALKRAFDPFFSSKSAGRRRGMGLAKALRWVEASGGSIRLESRANQGTRAMILLPAAKTIAAMESEPQRKTAT